MSKQKKATVIAVSIMALLLIVSIGAIVYMQLTRVEGAAAVVRIDGKEVARYALDKDRTVKLNHGTNTLVIQDGKAMITEADCPDKVCVEMGPIGYNGQVITCLPNRVTVTIEDAESEIDIAL